MLGASAGLQGGPSRAPDGPPRAYSGPYVTKMFTYNAPHDGNGIIYNMGMDPQTGYWTNPVVCYLLDCQFYT